MADEYLNESAEMDEGQPLVSAEDVADDDWGEVDPAEFYEDSAEEDGGTDQTEEASEASDEPVEDKAAEETDENSEAMAKEMAETLNNFLELKYLGETKKVSKDEAKVYAQKGMDYDRIRAERDQLKSEAAKNRGIMAYIAKQAEEAGMTVEDFVEYNSIESIKKKDTSLDSVGALMKARQTRLALEKEAAAEAEREATEKANAERAKSEAEQAEKEARQMMFLEFNAEYPDVPATEIPKSVWDGVAAGGNLTTLYTKYLAHQLKAENEKLRQETKNKARSAGSMKSKGGKSYDPTDIDSVIAADWD